jgi:hypothetical protein
MPASKSPARKGSKVPAPPAADVAAENLPTLDPETLRGQTTEQLVARGVAYVREYGRVEHQPTIILRNLAVVLVALRTQHTDRDGRPDLLGRSYDYKQSAAEIYRRAGIAPDSEERVQQNVRHHIGVHIRERFNTETLREYGLLPHSPVGRMQKNRETRRALLAAAEATVSPEPAPKRVSAAKDETPKGTTAKLDEPSPGATVKATADHLRFGQALAQITRQMDPDVVSQDMTDGQRAKLDEYLEEVQRQVSALRRRTRKARSSG